MEVAIEHVQVLVQACAERNRIRTAVRIALLHRPGAQGIGDTGAGRLVRYCACTAVAAARSTPSCAGQAAASNAASIQDTVINHLRVEDI